MRVPGHRLTVEWNGERERAESASTGRCPCGWSESCSSQKEVRREYRFHLQYEHDKRLSTMRRITKATG